MKHRAELDREYARLLHTRVPWQVEVDRLMRSWGWKGTRRARLNVWLWKRRLCVVDAVLLVCAAGGGAWWLL